jgi:hypothetical protein
MLQPVIEMTGVAGRKVGAETRTPTGESGEGTNAESNSLCLALSERFGLA